MNRIFRTIFSQKFLFYTNSLGSGIIMCVGDTIQQSVEMYTHPNKQGYDLQRIRHMGTIGLFLGAPQHYFYKYLDKYMPKKSIKSIAGKMFLDQAINSPVCILIFLGGLGYLERKSKEDVQAEIREKFLIIYSADWILWPPCQYVNFMYVKAKYRVMYVNAITVIYDAILSYIKYTETDDLFGTHSDGAVEIEGKSDEKETDKNSETESGQASSDRIEKSK